MNYDTVSPEDFGASLSGIGLNILVRDVLKQSAFLNEVFLFSAFQVSKEFAIIRAGNQVFQLHSDETYSANPLLHLIPESPPRGAGIEIRIYDCDPDASVARAKDFGAHILQEPTNKEHGLREAYIQCDNGYVWVPSRPL